MSGWLPGEKPDISEKELKELWEKYKAFREEIQFPLRHGKTAVANMYMTELTRQGVKVGVLKGNKSTGYAIDEWVYAPPIVMPTDWLAEVRAMCRKPPFRLRGEMVLRHD